MVGSNGDGIIPLEIKKKVFIVTIMCEGGAQLEKEMSDYSLAAVLNGEVSQALAELPRNMKAIATLVYEKGK
jgi:hypothetical protein